PLMKSIALAVSLATAALTACSGSGNAARSGADAVWSREMGGVPFVVGYDKGLAAAKASGKPPMYFFTATWCGWCKKLADESFSDADVVRALSAFTPVLVDGDAERSVCARFGVEGYPTVVFADAGGNALRRVDGYVPRDRFLAAAGDAASAAGKGVR